jgi:hypothetical protein
MQWFVTWAWSGRWFVACYGWAGGGFVLRLGPLRVQRGFMRAPPTWSLT